MELNEKEKSLIIRLIVLHKQKNGRVSRSTISESFQEIGENITTALAIINKAIALGLIEYTLSVRTGYTSLTKTGWDFESFEKLAILENENNELVQTTIEKNKLDIEVAKKQLKSNRIWSIGSLIVALITATATLYTAITYEKQGKELKQDLEYLQERLKDLEQQSAPILEDHSQNPQHDTLPNSLKGR